MKTLFLIILLTSSFATGAKLGDVKVLNVITGQDNVKLKLQQKNHSGGSYFFVDITKSDPQAFDKMKHVMKKVTLKDKYQLDLDILSFSATPSGSYYKSESVLFSSSTERQQGSEDSKKEKKK